MDDARRSRLFDDAVQTHGASVARLATSYERDAARAEELQQDIWVNVWRALPRFRADASLRTWLFRVAHNVAATHVGRRIKEPPATDAVADLPATDAPAAEQTDRRRSARRLRDLVSELPPLDRQLIVLYFEDVPQPEIAAITGLSVSNVSTRVHRIKSHLTRELRAAAGGSES